LDCHSEMRVLIVSAAQRGFPLTVLDVDMDGARSLYGYDLVLIRPDEHVACRGNEEPGAATELIDLVRGARITPTCTSSRRG
jgi:hypothetical protein